MSKTMSSNPTTNIFELLPVDGDLPQKSNTKAQGGKKPVVVDSSPALETPAEKGQRRKLQQAQQAAVAAAEKQKREAEEQFAATSPSEGFQVQKGSQTKKPAAEKKQTLNREAFETTKPAFEKSPKTFKNPKKTDGSGKPFDARPKDGERRPYTPNSANPARPPKHEGFDKHSGAKTSNKPGVKRQGGGQGNWGNDAPQKWDTDVVTTPVADNGPGWGDESEKKEKAAAPAQATTWGDEKADKPAAEAKEEKPRKIEWDEEEGHGKILLDQFQKDIASKRDAELAALGVGVKSTGRAVEAAADSKFTLVYRDTSDEKEKLLGAERKKQIADEKKKRQQQRVGEKPVDLSEYTNFGVRGVAGGRGGGRGGRGGDRPQGDRQQGDRQQGERQQGDRQQGDRPPRTEGDRPPRTEGGADKHEQASPESRPARGGRGGGRGGPGGPGNNRVPTSKNAFPALGAAPVTAAPVSAPKSTK